MREYADDNIRRYARVLQRMVIVAAVIIALPVMMWTISIFIRSYGAQLKIPTFQHLTLSESTQSPPPASPVAASNSPPHTAQPAPAPGLVDTVARDDDGRAPLPDTNAQKGPLLEQPAGDANPASDPRLRGTLGSPPPIPTVTGSSTSPPVTTPAAAPPDAAAPPAPAPTAAVTPRIATKGLGPTDAASTNRGFAWPDSNADTPSFIAPPQPPTIAETAPTATLPALEPIKGRIPLPRHRPSARAMTAGVTAPTAPLPLPRVRPTDAPVDTFPATNAPYGSEPSPSQH
jgi:hypothetical protein